jgi:hypothetical protein
MKDTTVKVSTSLSWLIIRDTREWSSKKPSITLMKHTSSILQFEVD